jgi:mRNA interferase HigB
MNLPHRPVETCQVRPGETFRHPDARGAAPDRFVTGISSAKCSENHCHMHIITRKRLNEFVEAHPHTKPGLAHWYRTIKPATIRSFAELRTLFPSADQVGKLTVFNIGGNTARLIAAIHYNRQRIYIRAILTHDEYDEGRWKE